MEAQLLRAARAPAGAPVDVAEIFAAHHLGLVRLALMMVGDQATAEDVVQDAFAGVHAGRRRLRDPDRALAYVRSAVLNGRRSALRKRAVALRRVAPYEPPIWSAESAALVGEDRQVVAASVSDLLFAGGPVTDADEIRVFLCKDGFPFPSCHGRAATPEQITAVRHDLAILPQVESVSYDDKETVYARFRENVEAKIADMVEKGQAVTAERSILDVVKVQDMPELIRLKMKPDTDWDQVIRAAQAMPGVSNVFNPECVSEGRGAEDTQPCSTNPPS
ncbi:permease-like cell division protein FtsX [Acrocarpospora catenulata]|uniref:permease-like cell division protein FtsX n=1 Tax=Acrocarpospora catenulata TaxID=2836182 RepID=UPI001BD99172|nr:permease-like cell division protein FtsX [Acrocarpospora catenulata]